MTDFTRLCSSTHVKSVVHICAGSQALAFVLGTHARCGRLSPARLLPPDLTRDLTKLWVVRPHARLLFSAAVPSGGLTRFLNVTATVSPTYGIVDQPRVIAELGSGRVSATGPFIVAKSSGDDAGFRDRHIMQDSDSKNRVVCNRKWCVASESENTMLKIWNLKLLDTDNNMVEVLLPRSCFSGFLFFHFQGSGNGNRSSTNAESAASEEQSDDTDQLVAIGGDTSHWGPFILVDLNKTYKGRSLHLTFLSKNTHAIPDGFTPTQLMTDTRGNAFLPLKSGTSKPNSASILNIATGIIEQKFTGAFHIVDETHFCVSSTDVTRVYSIDDQIHPVCVYSHTNTVSAGGGFLFVTQKQQQSVGLTVCLIEALTGIKILSFVDSVPLHLGARIFVRNL
ncbi:hypothetical protein Pelo_8791 [Pelomyxa schiedti]|nr:hypothetical protein Pelo_8791 [Pelomyxa schiedti]